MSQPTLHDRPIVILACRVFQHWLEQLLPDKQAGDFLLIPPGGVLMQPQFMR